MVSRQSDSAVFHALLDVSHDNLFFVDGDGRYTHVSRGGAAAIGLTAEQMIGRTWRELGLPASTMEETESQWRRVFESGERIRHELSYETPSGRRHYEYLMFPVGDLVGVISRDITGRVVALEQLRHATERYRSFVQNSSEGIWRFEVDEPISTSAPPLVQVEQFFARGFLAECNDAMARMYGFDHADEIVGARLTDMLDPAQEQNREYLGAFISNGYTLSNAESVEIDRHGNRKYFLNSLTGVVEDGRLLRAWGMQRDITAEKMKALDEEEQLVLRRSRAEFLTEANDLFAQSLNYEQTLRNLARMAVPRLADWCAVDMIEPDGSLRRLAAEHSDPEMLRLAFALQENYPADPNAPRGAANVVRTGKTDFIPDIPDEMLVSGARSPEHLELVRKLRLKSWICTPIHIPSGVAGVLTLVNGDESPRFTENDVLLAEQLAARAGHAIENARLYEQALEANRAKDEFLALLSHELRTPLTSILGWASLLRLSNYDLETVRNAGNAIEHSARLQATLIDDLLDISRIVTGKLNLNIAAIDAVAAVESGVAAVRPAAAARKIDVVIHAPQTLIVRADPNRLQQIVWNLMSNAVKFATEGSRIDVTVGRAGDRVELSVRDQGIGIDPALLPRVFERFWQADSTSHRRHGGLGLGLAIVKYLAELHGGTATAHSDGIGRGATFTVALPAGVADPRPESSSRQGTTRSSS